MRRCFRDNDGRKWALFIDAALADKLKTCHRFDPSTCFRPRLVGRRRTTHAHEVMNDAGDFANVLYTALAAQRQAQELPGHQELLRMLGGRTLARARGAFLMALFDFQPAWERARLRALALRAVQRETGLPAATIAAAAAEQIPGFFE